MPASFSDVPPKISSAAIARSATLGIFCSSATTARNAASGFCACSFAADKPRCVKGLNLREHCRSRQARQVATAALALLSTMASKPSSEPARSAASANSWSDSAPMRDRSIAGRSCFSIVDKPLHRAGDAAGEHAESPDADCAKCDGGLAYRAKGFPRTGAEFPDDALCLSQGFVEIGGVAPDPDDDVLKDRH